jgi:Pyrimidine dimer DNA glycosylase
MNLFILALIQKEIAESMFDKHVSKILLEAVQMLCSAMHVLEPGMHTVIYKMAHKNHPVTIWCRTSKENFEWTLKLIDCLHEEWRFRYKHEKIHKSYVVAQYLKEHVPTNFPQQGLTTFALAMPEEYKTADPVESYRAYYLSKRPIASWKNRTPPSWFAEPTVPHLP